MSKWIKKDKFKSFVNQREQEPEPSSNNSFVKKWKNPKMGTVEKANVYRVRLLPDKNSEFYKHYYYHYFMTDEKHHFIKCSKTDGMDNFCPWCSITQTLYKGNKEDKKLAKNYQRKERFVGNIVVIDDPRDEDVDDEYKVSGKVRLYEFPATIESKIKAELTDKAEGFGSAVFDPEDGHDLLIKIKAKKPDPNGKSWPDYSDTMFARKSTSLGTEKEIDDLMEETTDLVEYLKDSTLSWEEHKKLLQIEGVWEDVEDEWNRRVNETEDLIKKEKKSPNEDVKKVTINADDPKEEKSPDEDDQSFDDDEDEAALMAKLMDN